MPAGFLFLWKTASGKRPGEYPHCAEVRKQYMYIYRATILELCSRDFETLHFVNRLQNQTQ